MNTFAKSTIADNEEFFDPEFFNLPEPKLRPEKDPLISILSTEAGFSRPIAENINDYYNDYGEYENSGFQEINEQYNSDEFQRNVFDKLDNLISSFEAGYYSPPKKKQQSRIRQKK